MTHPQQDDPVQQELDTYLASVASNQRDQLSALTPEQWSWERETLLSLITREAVRLTSDRLQRLKAKQEVCYDCQHENPTLDDPVPYVSISVIDDCLADLVKGEGGDA